MLTFKEYLSEGVESTVNVATSDFMLNGYFLRQGDTYYLNGHRRFHRVGAPALIRKNGTLGWFINGRKHRIDGPACEYKDGDKDWYIDDNAVDFGAPDSLKWKLLKANLNRNFEILNRIGMNKEMQEYVLVRRPDLGGQIRDLDPSLKEKYSHEEELGSLDV